MWNSQKLRVILFQGSRPKANKHLLYKLNREFFATALILPDKSTPACTQKCIIWFIQRPWKTEIAFFLCDNTLAPCWRASFKTLELQPVFRCVRISIHLEFMHVKPPQAHPHVNALSTSRRKPISSKGQLDLKLFSDAVSRFIPTWSNLHGAFPILRCCWDWMCVGKILPFKQTGVSALSLRLTSCHQILISSRLLSSQQ